ncbi:hypothetical protein P167DRAFT_602795 [Morchella conica CCBAS932]|uniref:Mediator complex subunit 15 KIX domain-containing protein n=1 Tax=Morchella conica CCBAS932 TaxID=1392247 RepID=A0A3N4L3P2_9PEZI|nr:hypothetical protein P167DRAFT_602795 [Morchella conica CCBAS932]
MNSDFNQLQQQQQLGSSSTSAEMPSGARPALPKPKKAAGRERGNSLLQHFVKADISIEDQLKYRRHLHTASQNFVGFNKDNLHIIATSFEHLCLTESENKREYKAKIRAKLREWNYEDFSEDEEADGLAYQLQTALQSSESMQTTTLITGENLSSLPSSSASGSHVHRAPSERNPTPHSTGSTASKNSSKLGRSSSSRPRLPSPQQSFPYGSSSSVSSLFDPVLLDKTNLNDPAVRAGWVEAVWHYFNSGGCPPPPSVNIGRVRSSSFASMPSPASPTTPTNDRFRSLAVSDHRHHHHHNNQPQPQQEQHIESEYEVMEGVETYYQQGPNQQHDIGNLGQMVDLGALPTDPEALSYVQLEQWQKIQDQNIGNP